MSLTAERSAERTAIAQVCRNCGPEVIWHGSCDLESQTDSQFGTHKDQNTMQRLHMTSSPQRHQNRAGKIRYGAAAWLLGLPLPIIIIALFIRGCDW